MMACRAEQIIHRELVVGAPAEGCGHICKIALPVRSVRSQYPPVRSFVAAIVWRCARPLAALALVIGPAPAHAWDFEDKEGDCHVSQTFEGAGNTFFGFSQDQDWFDRGDRVFVFVQNDNWSVKNGEDLGVIRIETSEGWFENTASGFVGETMKGVVSMVVGYKNLTIAMDGYPQSLVITRGGKVIDRLNLANFLGSYHQFKSCHDRKLAVVKERERKEALDRNIPRDPFSSGK